uniref:Uncharacterized protein n=1 Tax=Tetradesmus obliquus TaxID=3088 RepID=A0A383VM66_TETOB
MNSWGTDLAAMGGSMAVVVAVARAQFTSSVAAQAAQPAAMTGQCVHQHLAAARGGVAVARRAIDMRRKRMPRRNVVRTPRGVWDAAQHAS